MGITRSRLRCGIVIFWTLWYAIVLASNTCDALTSIQWLPQDWPFRSGNHHFIQEFTSRYHVPNTVNGLLFLGVIFWEGTTTVLFGIATWYSVKKPMHALPAVRMAFAAGLGLLACFALLDEAFIAYTVEASHIRLLILQLMSLLFLELVTDDNRN